MTHSAPIVAAHSAHHSTPSLKQRAIRGSLWTLIGYGLSQGLRLGGNLVLTRLLSPEDFGLMALVQTFLIGLQMFSDFGIFPSIVQSSRGDDPKFLNTAWTIQGVRGIGLWLGSCLIAVPLAQFYQEPLLGWLLPVSGLTALISGLASTKLATANRNLALRQITLIDLGTNAIALAVMIIGAWIYRSIWMLVLGGIISNILRTIASHWLLPGERNQMDWDRSAVKEIQQFGRWIFLSTIIGFFALQSDRLMLGKLLDIRFLGIYSVALGLSSIVEQVVEQINSKVLFPSYSELIRDRPSSLYRNLRKARLILLTLSVGFATFFVFCGPGLIDLLYDDRYQEAGWILQILAIGFLGRVVSTTYGDVLMAKGQTFSTMTLTITGTMMQVISVLVGFSSAGYSGVILGLAAAEWLTYIAYAICFARLKLWQPGVDFLMVAIAGWLSAVIYYL